MNLITRLFLRCVVVRLLSCHRGIWRHDSPRVAIFILCLWSWCNHHLSSWSSCLQWARRVHWLV